MNIGWCREIPKNKKRRMDHTEKKEPPSYVYRKGRERVTEMISGLLFGAILTVLAAMLVHSWIENGEENGIVDLHDCEDAAWEDEDEQE